MHSLPEKPTFTMPLVIIVSSLLLSHSGYKITVKADINAQIIPMTTHAVKPPTPNTVCAKNSGRGMMISIMSVYKRGGKGVQRKRIWVSETIHGGED